MSEMNNKRIIKMGSEENILRYFLKVYICKKNVAKYNWIYEKKTLIF